MLVGVGCVTSGCATSTEDTQINLLTNTVRFSDNVKTWEEVLTRHIVMQKYDYSCGAAALATLLNYYFQDHTTEHHILLDIEKHLKEVQFENREEKGLSLLDLKQYVERRGYQAVGVKLGLSALLELRGPILVYLETESYEHFAVLRGVRGDRVFLADPSRGNIRIPIYEFAEEWPGIALVMGKKGFGTPQQYALAVDRKSPYRIELRAARQSLYLN